MRMSGPILIDGRHNLQPGYHTCRESGGKEDTLNVKSGGKHDVAHREERGHASSELVIKSRFAIGDAKKIINGRQESRVVLVGGHNNLSHRCQT
jgi:hypothetical protein